MRHIQESAKVDWNTPQWVIDLCREAMGSIELDPCSNPTSLVNANVAWTLPDHDGLKEPWNAKTVFVNPPYGRVYMNKTTKALYTPKEFRALSLTKEQKRDYATSTIYDWVYLAQRYFDIFKYDLCLLIPASVETKHWQKIIFKHSNAICFFKSRVKFIGGSNSPPMPTALIYYGSNTDVFVKVFEPYGFVLNLDHQRLLKKT